MGLSWGGLGGVLVLVFVRWSRGRFPARGSGEGEGMEVDETWWWNNGEQWKRRGEEGEDNRMGVGNRGRLLVVL
jgi:hypothetical protein